MNTKTIKNLSSFAFALIAAAGLFVPAATVNAQGSSASDKKKDPDLAASVNPDDPNAAKLYFIPVTGEIGRDFAVMTLRDIIKDMRVVQPDYIILDINTTWKDQRGEDKNLYNPDDAANAYGAVHRVEQIAALITDDIRDDKTWEKKPQVVAWVKRALGPSAFLPFVAPKIFYAPNALHGGIGFLDHLFDGVGDEVVREKQRALRLGWAEGLAIKGGHDPRIMRAMARVDYSLSYSLVGGKPVFYENITDGENILTDDGDPDAGRADSIEDLMKYKGNDVLTLTADVASRIGFAEGIAATSEDLAFELGVSRAYRVYREKATKAVVAWQRESENRRNEFMRMRDESRRIQVNGATASERNAQRGRIKRNLLTMVDLLTRFRDSLFGLESGDPDQIADQIRQRIAQIDQEIRLDRDTPGGGGRLR